MEQLTYYQVLDSNHEVLGTYGDYDTSLRNKGEGDTIRYWTGECWVYNVNDLGASRNLV